MFVKNFQKFCVWIIWIVQVIKNEFQFKWSTESKLQVLIFFCNRFVFELFLERGCDKNWNSFTGNAIGDTRKFDGVSLVLGVKLTRWLTKTSSSSWWLKYPSSSAVETDPYLLEADDRRYRLALWSNEFLLRNYYVIWVTLLIWHISLYCFFLSFRIIFWRSRYEWTSQNIPAIVTDIDNYN